MADLQVDLITRTVTSPPRTRSTEAHPHGRTDGREALIITSFPEALDGSRTPRSAASQEVGRRVFAVGVGHLPRESCRQRPGSARTHLCTRSFACPLRILLDTATSRAAADPLEIENEINYLKKKDRKHRGVF